MSSEPLRYTVGLDLGQTRHFTAMVVLERGWHAGTAAEFIASGSRGYQGEWKYTLVRTERLSLGTPYPRVVEWVKSVTKEYGEELGSIVVDASGVGSAVMDALRRAELGVRLVGVVITGDQALSSGAGERRDPGGVSDGVEGGAVDGAADGGAGGAVPGGPATVQGMGDAA